MDVDHELKCPICLDLFTHPIILPCSHVLCRRPCAENIFDYNFIRCPVCRDSCYVSGGISSLPRVIALENIIEKVQAERDRETLVTCDASIETDDNYFCQLCEKPPRRAKRSCLDCNLLFCIPCFRESHPPNKEPFNTHKIVEPKNDLQPEALCPEHGEQLSLYCMSCRRLFCLACEENDNHKDHSVLSLQEASTILRQSLNQNMKRLDDCQCQLKTNVKIEKDHIKDLQQTMIRKRAQINKECDTLLAEVENKRAFFLADLEYDERVRLNDKEESMKMMEKILDSADSLKGFTKENMSKNTTGFLEVAAAMNERVRKTVADGERCRVQTMDLVTINNKVVDFRNERAVLRDVHYLTVPSTPVLEVNQCCRSETTVALGILPHTNSQDVVDYFESHYCSEEQKGMGIEDVLLLRNCHEERPIAKNMPNGASSLVFLYENLTPSTTYFFCVSASNKAGKSSNSEVIQCVTLSTNECTVPMPIILQNLCKSFTSSIQIFSSSPLDVASEQNISHYLLYRPLGQNRIWRSVCLYGRQEHRAFGLAPNTEYEFIIMACNLIGECQLSSRVTLKTDQSAFYT
ncbi:hypothetical protein SNE40_015499 [Patella caerulea]|uniref:Uncharacterized protein n=1 Tax=Patella caerulea TaxID=87958 RepID=A0AAN8PV99_PATCE